jgi:hypothetical protein
MYQEPEDHLIKRVAYLSWYKTWLNALLNPSTRTFLLIADSSNLNRGRAYLWILIGSLGLASSMAYIFGPMSIGPTTSSGGTINNAETALQVLMLAMGMVVGFIVVSYSLHVFTSIFSDEGTFPHLVNAFAAYQSPLMLIIALQLVIVPSLSLTLLILGYGIFLTVIAVRAVKKLDWWSSYIGTLFLAFMALLYTLVSVYFFWLRN